MTNDEVRKILKDVFVLSNSMDGEHLKRLLLVLLATKDLPSDNLSMDNPKDLRKSTQRMISRFMRKRQVIKQFNHKQMKQIYTIMGDYGHFPTCKLCGKPIIIDTEIARNSTTNNAKQEFSWDHIYPKSLGGSDELINLQPTHKLCNNRKADKIFGHEHYVVNIMVDLAPIGRVRTKRKKKININLQLRKQDSWCHKTRDCRQRQ